MIIPIEKLSNMIPHEMTIKRGYLATNCPTIKAAPQSGSFLLWSQRRNEVHGILSPVADVIVYDYEPWTSTAAALCPTLLLP